MTSLQNKKHIFHVSASKKKELALIYLSDRGRRCVCGGRPEFLKSEGETSVSLETTRPAALCLAAAHRDPSALAKLSLAARSPIRDTVHQGEQRTGFENGSGLFFPQQQAVRFGSSRMCVQPLECVCFHSRSLGVSAETERDANIGILGIVLLAACSTRDSFSKLLRPRPSPRLPPRTSPTNTVLCGCRPA